MSCVTLKLLSNSADGIFSTNVTRSTSVSRNLHEVVGGWLNWSHRWRHGQLLEKPPPIFRDGVAVSAN